jgi:acyl-CoA thioesterase FadM
MAWIDTYRGTVHRWEVDNVDHFTVAYYFERFEDATAALLHALGLDPGSLARTGRACVTLDCHVRYLRELRMGDILHIRSGVISADADSLLVGHEVIDSGDGTLCTTVVQRMALAAMDSRAPLPLAHAQREAAASLLVEWTGSAPAETNIDATGADGFLETARDAIKPRELDATGVAGFAAYIHRFSAANGHVLAAFGVTPDYLKTERRGFSTFEFNLRFGDALRAGDLVRVQSALVHVGNSSMRILHRMTKVGASRPAATLEQAGVHLDMVARRPTPLPDELRGRAKALLVAGDQKTSDRRGHGAGAGA